MMDNEIERRLSSIEGKLNTIYKVLIESDHSASNFQRLDEYTKNYIEAAKKEIIDTIKEGK